MVEVFHGTGVSSISHMGHGCEKGDSLDSNSLNGGGLVRRKVWK
jgi:hypothetical protein